MKTRKLTSLFMAAVIAMANIPQLLTVDAFAADSQPTDYISDVTAYEEYTADVLFDATAVYFGDYKYSVLEDGTAKISDYIGDDTVVVIPSEIAGYKVTQISNSAFCDKSSITSITIPDSVTTIGNAAFMNCNNLTSITIPSSITSISQRMFSGSGLTSITIPDNITYIGEYAFSNCSNLTDVTISYSVTTIDGYAFYQAVA